MTYKIILIKISNIPKITKPIFCVNVQKPMPISTKINPINNNNGRNVLGFDKFKSATKEILLTNCHPPNSPYFSGHFSEFRYCIITEVLRFLIRLFWWSLPHLS